MLKLFNSFRGVRDNLVNPIVVATTCLMAIIHSTNKLQTILQSATLDWYQVPKEIKKLLKYLDDKNDDPSLSRDSHFGRLEEFFHVASQSAGGRYQNGKFIEFNLDRFVETFARPFLQDLKGEIVNAFELPKPLRSFSILEPKKLPEDKEQLTEFGKKEIHDLASFYGEPI